jgi:hypothetical protein
MRDNQESSESVNGTARRERRRLKRLTTRYGRSGGLAVLVAAAAVALAAFGGTGSSHASSLGNRGGSDNSGGSSKTSGTGARPATTPANDNSTGLLDQWAACERGHGDSNQAIPTVDTHGVIYIAVPVEAHPVGDPHDLTGTCSEYLAAARRAVAGGQPIAGWGNQAEYVKYANCMRANGFPTYPYPSGIEPDGNSKTNFNGTGIDPQSPAFLNGHANQTCGKEIGAPAWWINSWGPPGDVVVYPAGANPNSPLPIGPPSQYPKPTTAAILNCGSEGSHPSAVGK